MVVTPRMLGTIDTNFTNKNRTTDTTQTNPYINPADYADVAALDDRLARVSSGKLATAVAAGSTTTIIVLNTQAMYLAVNQVVDIYDNTDTPKASGTGKTITNISSSASTGLTTVTFTTAAGGSTAAGDYLRLATNPNSGSYSSTTLNKMTVNDKLYAARLAGDSATI